MDPVEPVCRPPFVYDVPGILIAVACIIVGILLLVWGYRLFLPTLFIATAFFIGFIAFGILDSQLPTLENREWIVFGVSIAAGLIAGFLAVCVVDFIGIPLFGLACGFVIGYILIFICGIWFGDLKRTQIAQWIAVAVFGVAFAIITVLALRKCLIIFIACVIGSFSLMNGIDYFVGSRQLQKYFVNGLFRGGFGIEEPCWYTWLMIAGGGALTLIFWAVQMRMYTHDVTHEKYVKRTYYHHSHHHALAPNHNYHSGDFHYPDYYRQTRIDPL